MVPCHIEPHKGHLLHQSQQERKRLRKTNVTILPHIITDGTSCHLCSILWVGSKSRGLPILQGSGLHTAEYREVGS